MHNFSKVIWLLWLSSSFIKSEARVNSNGTDSHIVLVEENHVRKLQVSASGEGKYNSTSSTVEKHQSKKTNSTEDEEEKKTLAQQVADGKYGLIQTELFDKVSKRPGIISYDVNPEVPKDNVNNLGGLHADEIWLAENHLLVLKGGGFSDKDLENTTWKPIDNYVAPKRQVKIPQKPKVAPPFPVQLKEGGPIEFIQGEKSSFRPFGPPPLLPPNVKNNFSGLPPALSYPFPPFGLPPPPPYPFPGNFSDLDEDDPRFYYPPPYDFVYDKDNSSHVAPGPLVPGIVLPPPVDFFAPLENQGKRPGQKVGKRPEQNDKNKLNYLNTYVPKTVLASKAKSVPAEHPSKNKEVDTKLIPERKEKEGRKSEGTKRPLVSTSQRVSKTPETSTKFSRVVTRPPDATASYVRGVSRPPLVTSTVAPRAKLPKVSSGDWVPIVGPTICPPGELSCYKLPVRQDKKLNHETSYFNKTDISLEFATEVPNPGTRNRNFYPITGPRPHFFTTTTSPYYDLKPIIVPTSITTASYKPGEPNNYDPGETYYIYGEPIDDTKSLIRELNNHDIRNGPTIVYVNHDVRPKYELNTVSPLQVLRNQVTKKPAVKVKNKPSPLEFFENELSTITNSNKFSITYTVGGRKPDVSQLAGYPYNVPIDDPFDNIIQNSNGNKKGRTKEVKTPIFEYSFSIPGYGQGDSPKISSIIPSTEKPEADIRDQYSFYGFDSRPVSAPEQYERNTQAPQEYTSQKSKYRKVLLNQLGGFLPTQAPYTQIFTQQEPEFIDDITKNYFTLFGKKINGETYSKYITTPLPPPAEQNTNGYYSNEKRQRTPKGPTRANVRFPEEANPQVVRKNKEQEYIPQAVEDTENLNTRPPAKPDNYNNPYYNTYRPKYYPRDYSLASDINVNYRKPYPPINPDAEYIDPSYVQGENNPTNSYISYQLPGNGGHFYFLTPQNIRATNYHLASSGVRFPSGYNRLYYKRSAQNPRNRRWINKKK